MAHRPGHFRDPRVPHWCLLITPVSISGLHWARVDMGSLWTGLGCPLLQGLREGGPSSAPDVLTGAESLSCPLVDSSQVESGHEAAGPPCGDSEAWGSGPFATKPQTTLLVGFSSFVLSFSKLAECIGKVVSVVMRRRR